MTFVSLIRPEYIFYSTLLIQWILFLWERYVSSRQYKVYQTICKIRPEHRNMVSEEVFEKSRQYKLEERSFLHFQSSFAILLTTFIFMSNFFKSCWDFSRHYGQYASDSEYMSTSVFLVFMMFLKTLVSLPFSYYFNFVIEERHGFNKQTFEFFVKDKIKSFLLTVGLGVPVGLICVYIIKLCGESFAFYLSLFIFAFNLFIFYIYGEFIAPLFDKFTELPQSKLRTRIEELASSLNFPLHRIFMVEGSKRSSHSNAYVTGFFNKKKIVLYDTLIEGVKDWETGGETEGEDLMNEQEIISILAHELGHWKNWDIFKIFVAFQIQLFLVFNASGFFQNDSNFFNAFGFVGDDISQMPTMVGLILSVMFVVEPFNEILNMLMINITRYNEFKADEFSTNLGYGRNLQGALIKLHRKNLSFIYNDWFFVMLNYTHPPLIERLDAITQNLKKNN